MKVIFSKDANDDTLIKVLDVRLSYPHLFKPFVGKNDAGETTEKYGGRFLLANETHGPEIEKLQKFLVAFQAEKFKGRIPKDRLFLRDGDDQGTDDYAGCWYISANEIVAPAVYGKNKALLKESDDIVYPGCYVHVLIKPWAQNNKYGKRANANLLAVQFSRKGERFGQGRPSTNEHFSDESSGDDFGDDGFGDGDDNAF